VIALFVTTKYTKIGLQQIDISRFNGLNCVSDGNKGNKSKGRRLEAVDFDAFLTRSLLHLVSGLTASAHRGNWQPLELSLLFTRVKL
jgi:hypothetical protein